MRNRAFTLIELLAVIIILGIILSIAVPSVNDIINNSTRDAFENDAKSFIKAVDMERTIDNNFNPEAISAANVHDLLGISDANYNEVSVNIVSNKTDVCLAGKNKWRDLVASGDYYDMTVTTGTSCIIPKTDESCFTFDSGTKTITSYDSDSDSCPKDVSIPDTIGGISVESIGESAFQGCNLTSISLPSSLHNIGVAAFYNNLLTKVDIPDSVTTISDYAFYINSISSLKFGANITSIGDYAFEYNSLKAIDIPSLVITIGNGAFQDNQLDTLTFKPASNLTTIGNWAFVNGNITAVAFPDSLVSIGTGAFEGQLLEAVTIPNYVTTIGNEAFAYNSITALKLGSSLNSVGDFAFMGNNLNQITMSKNNTTIGDWLLTDYNNYFRTAYYSGGSGIYTGTQGGTWTRQ